MVGKFNCGTELISDGYIKFHDFDNLYKQFENVVNNQCYKIFGFNNLNCDKYLLATLVGCIEGNIQIDIDNNSWYIWFGQYHGGYKVDSNEKFPYILQSIYEFIQNHIEYYNFITRYYDLWHSVPKYDNLEFIYDEYHIDDMSNNCQQLFSTINKDIENATENLDNSVIISYEVLYDVLNKLFCSKEIMERLY